jgi:hypothetical protein
MSTNRKLQPLWHSLQVLQEVLHGVGYSFTTLGFLLLLQRHDIPYHRRETSSLVMGEGALWQERQRTEIW